jgi:serine/threonine protein kinase/Flp pilus assembly protein TadD
MSDAPVREDVSLETLVAEVADEFLARRKRGERPAVEEYARRYPQFAEVLLQVLSSLELVQLASEPAPPVATAREPSGVLGDFRIVREIGRGGMGVVYEANQISLDRRVALKVLPFAGALDPKQLRRFKNEALAAAHLHHTNIVPVYGVGCEQGVHFYAMQYIEGRTLADVVAELRAQSAAAESAQRGTGSPSKPATLNTTTLALPTTAPPETPPVAGLSTINATRSPESYRAVARIVLQAAEALEHAHREGIVHRDVKPANLLVDVEGTLWVTDFGLARLQNDTGLTLSGDVLGTLRYMSPEQALGSPAAVDHRTDVYALGATMYELLTLRPVYEGDDRQDLLRRIAVEEPRPPRALQRTVPPELEVIVLKALEKDRWTRYDTAGALAEDLRRFLEYRPIRARRPSWLERARKLARRHRPAVASAAAALVVTALALAGSIGWVVRDRAAHRAKLATQLSTTLDEMQRSRAEGNWPQARASARRVEDLLYEGAAEEAMAARARSLLGDLAEQEADHRLVARLEEIRFAQAEVDETTDNFRIAASFPDYQRAFRDYGLCPDAMTLEQAVERLGRESPKVRDTVMGSLDHYLILARYNKAPEAGWLDQLLSAADTDAWRQRVRAARLRNDRRALVKLACDGALGQPPEELFLLAQSLHQRGLRGEALALLRRAADVFPGDFWINYDLGTVLQRETARNREAIRFLTVAVALRPDNPGVHLNLGRGYLKGDRLAEAESSCRRAITLKADYGMAHGVLGMVLAEDGRAEEGIAECYKAIALHVDPASVHYQIGCILRGEDRIDEAAASFRRAIELRHEFPEAHCNLGHALRDLGEFGAALAALRRGHELGKRRPDWRYPSAQWVACCERLIELDGRLPAVLRGESPLAGVDERVDCAFVCFARRRYAASARFAAEALADGAKPSADFADTYRYNAVCSAARAARREGADAGQLSDRECARLREQALQWLRADLAVFARMVESDKPEACRLVRHRLRLWQRDHDLASVRDPAALAELPAPEQRACKRLWEEIATLLAKAGAADEAATEKRQP